MKKLMTIVLSFVMVLTGCIGSSSVYVQAAESELSEIEAIEPDIDFSGLDDSALLDYIEDAVYLQLVKELDSDDYFVENVEAIYYPKEYIEEFAFNSQENLYFGYTASELDQEFQGTRYVFTLGDDGQTVVVPMETVDDNSFSEIVEDVIIGGGVILVCVTVSAVTGGVAPAVSMIFAASAKTATVFSLSAATISGAAAAITTGYQTEDPEEAFSSGIEAAAEGFKWGAIAGAVVGGGTEAVGLKGATLNGLTMNEAAAIQRESGYPLDLIKQFKSVEEYNVYQEAGLYTQMVDGKLALVREIDTEYVSELANGQQVTNLERMSMGYAAVEPETGLTYELHHINQASDGTLAILTKAEHQGNYSILNTIGQSSEIDREVFGTTRSEFWMKLAESLS